MIFCEPLLVWIVGRVDLEEHPEGRAVRGPELVQVRQKGLFMHTVHPFEVVERVRDLASLVGSDHVPGGLIRHVREPDPSGVHGFGAIFAQMLVAQVK